MNNPYEYSMSLRRSLKIPWIIPLFYIVLLSVVLCLFKDGWFPAGRNWPYDPWHKNQGWRLQNSLAAVPAEKIWLKINDLCFNGIATPEIRQVPVLPAVLALFVSGAGNLNPCLGFSSEWVKTLVHPLVVCLQRHKKPAFLLLISQ